jgi:predicted RecB family nuclease
MSKTITSEILVAYSLCPYKAYLLLCTREKGTPHEYVRILEQQRQATQRKYITILRRKNVDVQSYNPANLEGKHEFLVNATLVSNGLVAECAILNKVRTHSTLGRYSYEPTIFIGTCSIKKEQKLELFFVSHVLEQIQSRRPVSGRIIGLDEKPHKVNLENSTKTLRPFLESLEEWVADVSLDPPPLILNKHCSACRFYDLCRVKAEQEDNLSLLGGISTLKAINKYKKKGIFTVKQLSYTFKPRKRKKRAKNPPPVIHKPELQALAIREGKIYLQELPQLTRQPVELFLDIEGIPDQQFYYLIGLLVGKSDSTIYHSFWADTCDDEAQIWQQFLAKANQYPNAPIYHYGSFESRTLGKLANRYESDAGSVLNRLVNVNKHIFGKVYFPVYSNRLKELGTFVGASWSAHNASGLQSLVWRHHWEETREVDYRALLLTYNEEDCRALKLLTNELSNINHSANTLSEVDFADQYKERVSGVGQQVRSQFKEILKFAHFNYDKKKISFRQEKAKRKQNIPEKQRLKTKKLPKHVEVRKRAKRIVQISPDENCPKCGYTPLETTNITSRQFIIDLVLTKNGLRKTITQYSGLKGYCQRCNKSYAPALIRQYKRNQVYDHGFGAWLVHQRVALRLPYESIVESSQEYFNEKISVTLPAFFLGKFAEYYAETEELIVRNLLTSLFIHVDETKVNIKGENWYVWVFTNEQYVIFRLSETRESTIVHEFLSTYEGILVSDFYPGYDSVPCRQQKCWVHLIGDLNDDLQSHPFDKEYETFILAIRDLFVPIMEAVQRYGLKKRNLNKFKESVDKFYQRRIIDKQYKSDLVLKYQKRFIRYRNSLFTFLEEDSIPWHNNTAERAIRPFAIQREVSKSPFQESVTRDYLVLLSIRQTCRFQGKSFFKFLYSRETNLDKFEVRKRKRRI